MTHMDLRCMAAGAFLISLGLWGMASAIVDMLSMPVVYESYQSRRCTRVDDPAGKYDCWHLPPRYNHVWVE
jgi:hypothetical protein